VAFSSVLIVDDEPAVRNLMARWASAMGLEARTAGSADEALQHLQGNHYDLAVVDVRMPGRNGFWLADNLRREHPGTAVVLSTAYTEVLEQGAPSPAVADLLIKPFRRDRFVEAVDRGREWQAQARADVARHAELLNDMRRAVVDTRLHVDAERRAGRDEAEVLMHLLERRRPDEHAHSERSADQAAALARTLELDVAAIQVCRLAARLHDIGKLAVPSALLSSPGPLGPGDLAIVRRHVEAGADILADTTTLAGLVPFVLASHEWFGGGGYPNSLSGHEIPLVSRITAVVDAYDAMTHGTAYRGAVDTAAASAELLRCTPRQFDPEVVIPFLTTLSR
jgi:response regulator RpfG family c-di-GMP phosphodiesterase